MNNPIFYAFILLFIYWISGEYMENRFKFCKQQKGKSCKQCRNWMCKKTDECEFTSWPSKIRRDK